MQYMFLIYSDEATDPLPGTPEGDKYLQEYFAFNQKAEESGVLVAGDALQKVETATTVRVRGDGVSTTDGPFAETKEVLGGYYLLNCKDLDEAIQWATKIPTATHGSIEIRPIMEFD